MLRPLGKLSRDEQNGFILENGSRVISFRVGTFQALCNRLTSMVGSIVGRTLLYGIGVEIGQVALRYSREEIKSENELGEVFDRVLTIRGWGRCVGFERQNTQGKLAYVCRVKGGPSAHERTSSEPVCHLIGGIVAGWLEAYLNRKAKDTVEIACAAMGSQYCVFETTFS